MLTIDGSFGEGGGQILRSSLTLSLLTGRPFRIRNIRANRPNPGLARQHLTALRAAAEAGEARVQGDALGSREVVFEPRAVRGGDFAFSIEGAGSTTLVLQTVLIPLLAAEAPSTLTLEGGTHNPYAPPFDFLDRALLPLIRDMGGRAAITLERPGFYPAGGGRLRAEIRPSALEPLELFERGPVRRLSARALVSALPRHVGERELATVAERLEIAEDDLELAEVEDPAGPGNAIVIAVETERLTEVFTGFGERGVPAEPVAEAAASEAEAYLEAGVPVGERLADQLLLPLAAAAGGAFRTTEPSTHTRTNAEVIQRFTGLDVTMERTDGERWEIGVSR